MSTTTLRSHRASLRASTTSMNATTPLWAEQANEEQKLVGGRCPFNSGNGYCTELGREDWIKAHGLMKHSADIPTSNEANPDSSTPLYYWQLHSLLGPKNIESIVSKFYTRIYCDDEDEQFRDVFIQMNGLEHQILKQTHFWMDVFGGGEIYLPGEYGVVYHHNQPLAKTIMNAAGASRWMYHMSNVLSEMDFSSIDIRIKPCIIDFVKTKMKKYAKEHKWKFNDHDFNFIRKDPEMVRYYERKFVNIKNLSNDYLINTLTIETLEEYHQFLDINTFSSSSSLSSCLCGCSDKAKKKELVELFHEGLMNKYENELDMVSTMNFNDLNLFLTIKGLIKQTNNNNTCIDNENDNIENSENFEKMLRIAKEFLNSKLSARNGQHVQKNVNSVHPEN